MTQEKNGTDYAVRMMKVGTGIYNEVISGNSPTGTDSKRLREGIRIWLNAAMIYMRTEFSDEQISPGVFLDSALYDLDRGIKNKLFELRYEPEWDPEEAKALGFDEDDLPKMRTKRRGAPGKGSFEAEISGGAAAIAEALRISGTSRAVAIQIVCDALNLEFKYLDNLIGKLTEARGRGKADHNKADFAVFSEWLGAMRADEERTEIEAFLRLRELEGRLGEPYAE